MKDWIIGIDVAADDICFQIENVSSGEVLQGVALSTVGGFAQVAAVCKQADLRWEDSLVLIEATGRYHLSWCERLHREGAAVFCVNPLLIKKLPLPRNIIRDNKDDPLDAETLCYIGRRHFDQIASYRYRPDIARSGLSALYSARKCLRSQLTNMIKSASDMLGLVFPDCRTLGINITHLGFCSLLKQAPTPALIAATPAESLKKAVGPKAEKLLELSRNSFASQEVSESCAPALIHLLESIEELRHRIGKIDRDIRKALANAGKAIERRELLIRSLPGFGSVTAAAIASVLPEGFENWGNRKKIVAKLQAYFGCDPRRRTSGKSVGKTKLSKRGCGWARTALYQASFCAIKYDPQMREYYDKKKAEGDHHTKAVIDLVRKNLRRIVAVILQDAPFEPQHRNA